MVSAPGQAESEAHVCLCGERDDEHEAADSLRFHALNLGKAIRDAVGEMCPNTAPATREAPETGLLSFNL